MKFFTPLIFAFCLMLQAQADFLDPDLEDLGEFCLLTSEAEEEGQESEVFIRKGLLLGMILEPVKDEEGDDSLWTLGVILDSESVDYLELFFSSEEKARDFLETLLDFETEEDDEDEDEEDEEDEDDEEGEEGEEDLVE